MVDRIGRIVRTARERENRSLQDVADRSGVPLSVLEALEQGQRGITTAQLDDVARELSLDPIALLNGREVQRPVPSVFLKHEPIQDFDDGDSADLDDALEQGRTLASLWALLGEPALALRDGNFKGREAAADGPGAPAQDGYRLAREVRRWLGNTAEPLGDVRALIEERFGIAVVVRLLRTSRMTATAIRAGGDAAIVLNANDPLRSQNPLLSRVNLLHELCHVLFDPSSGGLHLVVDWSVDRTSIAAEQRARAFSAEMLLPLDGLTGLLGPAGEVKAPDQARDLVARARSRFGTPHDIAANHLCNLRFVDLELRHWLEAGRTTFAGMPPATMLPADGAPSLLVADLVERAHRDDILTDSEARAILGIDRLAPLPGTRSSCDLPARHEHRLVLLSDGARERVRPGGAALLDGAGGGSPSRAGERF
jgi:transcriptional regulator with XRE-family HTH domain